MYLFIKKHLRKLSNWVGPDTTQVPLSWVPLPSSLEYPWLSSDLGRFRIRSRNQRTNLNPNPDLIPDSESCVVESDLESESCRLESESDSDS